MDKEYERHYQRLESEHWWFRSRREIVVDFVSRYQQSPLSRILDVGCFGGSLIHELSLAGYRRVTGIDISSDAVTLCRKRGLLDTHAKDAHRTTFDDESFDMIIASDVLEHLEREKQALEEWRRLLKPRGPLLVFVPAFEILWSEHDDVNNHFRRYSKIKLNVALIRSGFAVERSSYWNFLLFFPIFGVRIWKRFLSVNLRKHPGGDLFALPPV